MIIGVAAILSGCSQGQSNEVTQQGTVSLEKIRINSPESILKEAMVSFVKDPSPTASAGGKAQYLSREKTTAAGQYMVQCKDGVVFQISEVFAETPTTKEPAIIELRKLLPADAPEQSRVEDKGSSEIYYYGSIYTGELNFKDATKAQVTSLTATNLDALTKAQNATLVDKANLKPLVDKAHEPK